MVNTLNDKYTPHPLCLDHPLHKPFYFLNRSESATRNDYTKKKNRFHESFYHAGTF